MPFVTMIAGPNGSGESTLISELLQRGTPLGEYMNADDIAAGLMGPADVVARQAQAEVRSTRARALAEGRDYCFETVMSHVSHLEHFAMAKAAGYTTRLFFVATDDPAINRGRVADRVRHGGHYVPIDRIETRYHRSLAQLPRAIAIADHVLIFDNSYRNLPLRLLAEIAEGHLRHNQIARHREGGPIFIDTLPGWWREILSEIMPPGAESKDGPLAL